MTRAAVFWVVVFGACRLVAAESSKRRALPFRPRLQEETEPRLLTWRGFHLTPKTVVVAASVVQTFFQVARNQHEARLASPEEKKGPAATTSSFFERIDAADGDPEATSRKRVTFADVGGQADRHFGDQRCFSQAEAVGALRDVSEFVVDPSAYEQVGARPPAGVLLYGPPGCGKTLLAKALATEANCSFFAVSGSSFVEVYSGLGAKRVRELFAAARAAAPAIVFIDELDSLAKKRSGAQSNEEREHALNQLLVELDGFNNKDRTREGLVVVVAATNRRDMLDEAAIRAGRFDKHVRVNLPDLNSRLLILRNSHATTDDDALLRKVAKQTSGFSGAELAALMNDASLRAARRRGSAVMAADVDAALSAARGVGEVDADRAPMSGALRWRVAAHEAGHALAALVQDPRASVEASIERRSGGSNGRTTVDEAGAFADNNNDDKNADNNDDAPATRRSLLARLRVSLAGQEAEAITFGDDEVSVMSQSDNAFAWTIATVLVAHGFRASSPHHRGAPSDAHGEARRFIEQERKTVHETLKRHAAALDAIAQALDANDILTNDDLRTLVHTHKPKPTLLPLFFNRGSPLQKKHPTPLLGKKTDDNNDNNNSNNNNKNNNNNNNAPLAAAAS